MGIRRSLILVSLGYVFIFSVYFSPIISHLNTRVYGLIGDNFWWFVWGWWSKNYQNIGVGSLYHNPLYGIGGFDHIYWNSTHPLSWGTMAELLRIFPTNATYNLIMLITFPLAGFFGYLFFYYLTKNKVISFLFGLIFSFSPYHLYSAQRHTELAITWVIPLFILTFINAFDKRSIKSLILASAASAITLLSSIYWGVYLSIFIFCYMISVEIMRLVFKEKSFLKSLRADFIFYVIYLSIFVVLTIPLLFPYIRVNYLEKQDTTRRWVYQNTTVVKRGLSDFMRYSIMPYHFVIPPIANPITGTIGKNSVSYIQENWHYFLAQNYFFSEHGGDFLGWANLCLFLVAVYFSIRHFITKLRNSGTKRLGKKEISKLNVDYADNPQRSIWTFTMSSILLYLFCMPPYFTIHGIKIFTPAYLVYTFFPMLRTLSRMGVIIFVCVLAVNSIFLSKLCISTTKKYVLVLIFTLITLLEFYMPIKYVEDANPPPAYSYIGSKNDKVTVHYVNDKGDVYNYEGPSFVVEYPWGYDIAAFYQKYHKKGFANPLFYVNPSLHFNAMEFSYELDSKGGLQKAYALGVRYVIYHKGDEDTIKRMDRGENPLGFFKENTKSYKDFGETIVFEL